ncbi:hypothetical protein BGZ57DRAFT_133245 [Hyaloscypha finlandica]|nr:hypothetical protein F5882DRAFT_56857 [Hyaloscypha sp. PMI_1271]KAH8787170.1 hypothetical protein BGZ57DRAFT_133245 [Hyaloscypha finlandica]
MRFFKILLASCILCRCATATAADSSPRPDDEALSSAPLTSRRGMGVKATASKFLSLISQQQGKDLDPRTWVVDDTEKAPKAWKVSSLPQCLLTRSWDGRLGWIVKLSHEETPHLNLLVRVNTKLLVTPKFGGLIISSPKLVSYEVCKVARCLKPVAIAIVPTSSNSIDLRKSLYQSLDSTFPITFHDQIPGSNATVADVRRWIKLWFLEHGVSPKATNMALKKSINRLEWDGQYLWKRSKHEMQRDLKDLGFSEATTTLLGRDIVAARTRVEVWRLVVKLLLSVALVLLAVYVGYQLLCQ